MEDLITFGSLVGGTWALSLFGLKSIRDSEEAEEPLKDAAAAAIVAVNFIAGMAASVYLGWNLDNAIEGGVVAGFIFLVPFIAMAFIYFRAQRRTRWVSKQAKQKLAKVEAEAKIGVKAEVKRLRKHRWERFKRRLTLLSPWRKRDKSAVATGPAGI